MDQQRFIEQTIASQTNERTREHAITAALTRRPQAEEQVTVLGPETR